jgi:hypothetical protein
MDILKSVIEYIRENHSDAGMLIDYTHFVNNSSGKKPPGYSNAVFTADSWKITIGHTVTRDRIYKIKADYNSGEILWTGQIKNGQLEEKSYEKMPSG